LTSAGEKTLRATIRYLRAQGVEQTILAGLSNGAIGAAGLAPRLRDELTGLVLLSGYYDLPIMSGLPVLMIHGKADTRFSLGRFREIASGYGEQAKAIEMEGSHFLLIEDPDHVIAALSDWLRSFGMASAAGTAVAAGTPPVEHTLVLALRKHLGTDYTWDGRLTKRLPNLDCLGLIFRALEETTGVTWDRWSVMPSRLLTQLGNGRTITRVFVPNVTEKAMVSGLEPGDVIFFLWPTPTSDKPVAHDVFKDADGRMISADLWVWHTAIYTGANRIIHASPFDGNGKVIEEPLFDFAKRQKFLGFIAKAPPTTKLDEPYSDGRIRRYRELLGRIEKDRGEFAKRYTAAGTEAKATILSEAEEFVFTTILKDLFPAWYGTPWEFDGRTDNPGEGSIACGFFVLRVLRDAGFKVPVDLLAVKASEEIILALADPKDIKRFHNADMSVVRDYLVKSGNGLYIVGLDQHTGFIVNDGDELSFVHSSYYKSIRKVVSEPIETQSPLSQSKCRVIGKILSGSMMRAWLEGNDRSAVP
jgi:cell wall-associated NlpC family hydrolase